VVGDGRRGGGGLRVGSGGIIGAPAAGAAPGLVSVSAVGSVVGAGSTGAGSAGAAVAAGSAVAGGVGFAGAGAGVQAGIDASVTTNGAANRRRIVRADIRGRYHVERSGRATLGGVGKDAATTKLAAIVDRGRADLAAVAVERSTGDALALEVEGDLAFDWRVLVLRSVMSAPPDGDAVREVYGEIVDRYRSDPKRLAELRPLGDEIRRLEADGALPSALVARSDRRSRP